MRMADLPLGGISAVSAGRRDPAWELDWAAAKRLLCVRLDTLGDVAMMEPALRALRRAAPGRRLTLLTFRFRRCCGPVDAVGR